MTLTTAYIEQLRNMGRYYAEQEIARRIARGMSVEEATRSLGDETLALMEQSKESEDEFAERHRELLRGILKRCD